MVSHYRLAQLCADSYTAPLAVCDRDSVARCTTHEEDGVLVLSFPGTNPINIYDDLTDIDFLTKSIPGFGPMHSGFWNAMYGIRDELDELIGDDTVILTGHSLGGAIALDYALFRRSRGLPVMEIVTFGSPRVSASDQASRVIKGVPITMYRHSSDPVPQVPPRFPMIEEWQHPAPLTQLGADRDLPNIEDHMISQYLTALEVLK